MKNLLILTTFLLSNAAFAEENTWSHESELGLVLSGGNSDTKTLNTKQKTVYKWTQNSLTSTGSYLYGESAGIESANSWSLGLRYDRFISADFTVFVGDLYEGDKFAGFDRRNNVDTGGKYFFINKSKVEFVFTEVGYRLTSEKSVGSSSSETEHFARVYVEGGTKLNESTTAKMWIEYLPSVSDSMEYKVNIEPSLSVMLDKNFSLKVAYLGKYNNTPAGAGSKRFDYVYSTALVAKF